MNKRLGKCQKWVLENSPLPNQEPCEIRHHWTAVHGEGTLSSITGTIKRLAESGLVEVSERPYNPAIDSEFYDFRRVVLVRLTAEGLN